MCIQSDKEQVKHRYAVFYSAGMINAFGKIPILIVKGGPHNSTSTGEYHTCLYYSDTCVSTHTYSGNTMVCVYSETSIKGQL